MDVAYKSGKEETIYKLTGASINKIGIKDRGLLLKGMAADITILIGIM